MQLTIPGGLKENNGNNAKGPAGGRGEKVASGEGTSAFLPGLCQVLQWDYDGGEETNPQRVQGPRGKTEADIAGECRKESPVESSRESSQSSGAGPYSVSSAVLSGEQEKGASEAAGLATGKWSLREQST